MILDIEVLPRPVGTPESEYAHVEAAIAVIQRSGLHHEVHALGTTVEGDPAAIWDLARRIHEATLASGAEGVVTVAKFQQSRTDNPPTMASLTAKFR
ncbi:MAG: thiamine-binding protein [Dehalococcoidia bacterium]|nr:MAG: thiamine-binding protein [Dehalococcoidia bacterium]